MVADVPNVLPPVDEKAAYVAEMFGRIAPRYDLMNTLMTGGLDRRWRGELVELALASLPPDRPGRVLDIGTGTGKLLVELAARAPRVQAVGVDFAVPMLIAAPPGLDLAAADGLRLPFAAEQFDVVLSAFVVRNLADRAAGLAEQVRVLRPGGQLLMLETTPGPPGVLGWGYRLAFRGVVPLLGRLVAGDATAYTYLPESTQAFVRPAQLVAQLQALGLKDVTTQPRQLGAVAITRGRAPTGVS
jgi:demethylmenaquinone methyltransferase/2-methoxy-6-polyprenyl-1,4-benzoquinol methylase